MKLDAKAKRLIRKDRMSTCGYIYTDGILILGKESHRYKGDIYEKEVEFKVNGEIPIYIYNCNGEGPFIGRIVLHNPTLLLDGILKVEIYRNNTSEKMKEMNLTCDTVTLTTEKGIRIRENIFHFVSSDFHIQNTYKMSVDG